MGIDGLLPRYEPYQKGEAARILFLFEAASFWPSWESVYEAFRADPGTDARIVLVTRRAIERSQMVSARSFLEERGIPYETDTAFDIRAFRPHAVFVHSPYDLTFHVPALLSLVLREHGCRIVYIPYGIEIADTETARKDHFQNFVVENCWRVYTSSEEMAREYLRYCRNAQAVRATGSPKHDWLAGRGRMPLPLRDRAHARGRKLVVWKMHFPKVILDMGRRAMITPDPEEYLAFARGLGRYPGIELLVLPHPKLLYGTEAYDVQGDESPVLRMRELLELLDGMERVTVCRQDDYRPALAGADAILLDRSGTMAEAAMAGAPILFLENAAYREPWTPPAGRLVAAFAKGSCCRDMERFLQDILQGNLAPYLGYRAALQASFPFRDGKCGLRVKEDVLQGLAEPPPGRCRVALYATGRICRYYLEQAGWQEEREFRIAGIFDSSPTQWGRQCAKWTIRPPEELKSLAWDALVIMSDFYYYEIKRSLVYDLYLDERNIWRLDEFAAMLDRPGTTGTKERESKESHP